MKIFITILAFILLAESSNVVSLFNSSNKDLSVLIKDNFNSEEENSGELEFKKNDQQNQFIIIQDSFTIDEKFTFIMGNEIFDVSGHADEPFSPPKC